MYATTIRSIQDPSNHIGWLQSLASSFPLKSPWNPSIYQMHADKLFSCHIFHYSRIKLIHCTILRHGNNHDRGKSNMRWLSWCWGCRPWLMPRMDWRTQLIQFAIHVECHNTFNAGWFIRLDQIWGVSSMWCWARLFNINWIMVMDIRDWQFPMIRYFTIGVDLGTLWPS